MSTKSEKFEIANDPDFIIAIMDAEEGAPPLQSHKFKTIGDRVRLLEELEKAGYQIFKLVVDPNLKY